MKKLLLLSLLFPVSLLAMEESPLTRDQAAQRVFVDYKDANAEEKKRIIAQMTTYFQAQGNAYYNAPRKAAKLSYTIDQHEELLKAIEKEFQETQNYLKKLEESKKSNLSSL